MHEYEQVNTFLTLLLASTFKLRLTPNPFKMRLFSLSDQLTIELHLFYYVLDFVFLVIVLF